MLASLLLNGREIVDVASYGHRYSASPGRLATVESRKLMVLAGRQHQKIRELPGDPLVQSNSVAAKARACRFGETKASANLATAPGTDRNEFV